MTVVKATPTRLRFRHSGALWLAAVLTLAFAIPFASGVFVELRDEAKAMLAPVAVLTVLVPLLIAVWSLRSGVDVTAEGLTVKALLSNRRLKWAQVRGFATAGRTVYALLDGDTRLTLPSVRPQDLPQLIEAGGEELLPDPDETGRPDTVEDAQ
jgi:hypothetical protein